MEYGAIVCDPFTSQTSTSYSAETRPNIILILADDYGFNDIGYHGSEIKTPNLDQLASEGVKLENYNVQPICSPTRSQLLSGRYQIHTGLQHGVIRPRQANGLPLEIPTIADKMKSAGYATHAADKRHLGFHKEEYFPTNRGFDTFYGRGIWEADPKSGRTAIHPHENTNKTVWLFNITNDPTESLDLSMKYPEMVKKF
ncbi:arylsulfatase I-like [Mytilus galloprovincialis]|uniref:arylsulfatase I-like n=1 Tax=Mytilus galloprovincialis TaxID=29158 RepID=UPI003F7B7C89